MGASVAVNGVPLGVASDQFLRYEFALQPQTHRLRAGAHANRLTLAFDPSIDCGGRFMACTGGWDWAPYTHTFQGGAHTFTKGIWKSVYLAVSAAGSAAITHLVPQVRYRGDYPTAPLAEGCLKEQH